MISRFALERTTWGRRPRRHEKVVLQEAPSFKSAYVQVQLENPNWAINCAWPLWPQAKAKIGRTQGERKQCQ